MILPHIFTYFLNHKQPTKKSVYATGPIFLVHHGFFLYNCNVYTIAFFSFGTYIDIEKDLSKSLTIQLMPTLLICITVVI